MLNSRDLPLDSEGLTLPSLFIYSSKRILRVKKELILFTTQTTQRRHTTPSRKLCT